MSGERIFVDTNILVYAYEPQAGDRGRVAAAALARLWQTPRDAIVSTQVLQELYVTLLRKKVAPHVLRRLVEVHMKWQVVSTTPGLLRHGIGIRERYGLSLWDAMIVAAARQGQAAQLWTEDLSAGQEYEGVRVVNPLVADESEPTG